MKLSGFVNSWTTKQWLYLAICLAVYVIATVLVYYLDSKNLSNVIYWLTGLIVLMYTIETFGMRLEMVRQNDLAIQPLVIAVIGSPDGEPPTHAEEYRTWPGPLYPRRGRTFD